MRTRPAATRRFLQGRPAAFAARTKRRIPARLGLYCRGALICAALTLGFADAARADFWDDIAEFFGNAPELPTSSQCNSYALNAVGQVRMAQRNNCPLSGPRYGTDEKAHYFWCMGVSPDTSIAERDARATQVSACADNQDYCNSYGNKAGQAALDNKLYNCKFTGPRWGEGSEGHRAYCLSERIAQRVRGEISSWPQSETTLRNDLIDKCKGKNPQRKIAFCTNYANEAVADAKTFKEKNCDASQNNWGRWETDYVHHFSWCIGRGSVTATNTAGNSETGIRNAAIEACLARGGGPPRLTPVVNQNSGAFGPPKGGAKTLAAPSNPNAKTGTGTGGAYLVHQPKGGSSALDRLGGGNALDAVRGGSGGVDLTPSSPCTACGAVQSNAPAKTATTPGKVITQPSAPVRPSVPRSGPDFNPNYGAMSKRPPARIDVR